MSRPLLLLLLILASGCDRYTCEQASDELEARPELASTPEDGRWALGLSLSTTLLNRVFAQAIDDGRGFPQRFDLEVPGEGPVGRMRGDGRVELEGLRLLGPGACAGCARVEIRASARGAVEREELENVGIRAVSDVALAAEPSGSELVLTAELKEIVEVELTGFEQRLRDIGELLGRRSLRGSGGPSEPVADALIARMRTGLEEAIRQELSRAAADAVSRRELTRVAVPPLGTAPLEVARAEITVADGGVFVGLDPADWPAGQGVSPGWSEHDVALVLPSHSAVELIDRAMRGGALPSSIDRQGKPADDGEFRLRPTGLQPEGDHFRLTVSAFAVEGVCGRVDLASTLQTRLEQGELEVTLGAFESTGSAGAGRAAAAGLSLYDRFSDDQLELTRELAAQGGVDVLGHAGTMRLQRLSDRDGALLAELDLRWRAAPKEPRGDGPDERSRQEERREREQRPRLEERRERRDRRQDRRQRRR